MTSNKPSCKSLVDDQKRGRVLSIFIMARRGIESLGSRLFGIVANWVGTPDALVIGGTAARDGGLRHQASHRSAAQAPFRGNTAKTSPDNS
jgi:hypothetical protein